MLLTKSVPSNGPEPSNQLAGALGVWGRKPQGCALPLSQGNTWMDTGSHGSFKSCCQRDAPSETPIISLVWGAPWAPGRF